MTGNLPSIFFQLDSQNAGLTGTEYPLCFAPEVVQRRVKYDITLEVSSAA
jgi:hypothetical protein